MDRQTESQTNRQIDKKISGQTETDILDQKMDGQIGKQTGKYKD